MKKYKIFIISVFVIGLIAYNFSIIGNIAKNNLSLSSLKQAFAGEIEEITITCDSGGSGVCYEAVDAFQKLCNGTWIWSWDCTANGDPDSWCVPFDPC